MSETNETTSTGVDAQGDALTQAVAASHAAPAPTNPVEQMIATLHQRVAGIEEKVSSVEQTVNGFADVAAVAPSTSPWVHAFRSMEDFVNGILAAFEGHFQGKIALPAPTDGAIAATLPLSASTADAGKVRLGAMAPSLLRV